MRIGHTPKSTAIRFCSGRAPCAKKGKTAGAQELPQPCALKSNSLAALKLSTASACSPSKHHLTVIVLFWAVALATAKVGASGRDFGNIFRDYLWAAPCLVVLKLSTASASSQNTFRPFPNYFASLGDKGAKRHPEIHTYFSRGVTTATWPESMASKLLGLAFKNLGWVLTGSHQASTYHPLEK